MPVHKIEVLGVCARCGRAVTAHDEWIATGPDKKQYEHVVCPTKD